MGNVIMCAGGGGVKSDDVTATLANVLEGKTALTSDSDDDVGVGTMPECGAITLAPTGNNTLTSGEGHYDSVTADGSLAYAAGLSYKTLHKVKLGSVSGSYPDTEGTLGYGVGSFGVSGYIQYGITADNIVLSNVTASCSSRMDAEGNGSGSGTIQVSLSGSTVTVKCPCARYYRVWNETLVRTWSFNTSCDVYLTYFC